MKVFLVAGARPNSMNIYRASMKHQDVDYRIILMGQHYDQEMSQAFFDDLAIPLPAYSLNAAQAPLPSRR